MKVKELIKKLECYNPDAEVGFTLNPVSEVIGTDGDFDIELLPELIGNEDCPEFLCMVHKSKFDSISELLLNTKKEINIKMTEDGLFVFKDYDLVREIERSDDFCQDESFLNNYPEKFIKMLIRIL